MKRLILTISLCVMVTSTMVLGDWDVGDPYKMHYPQLPDPFGWDIYAGPTSAGTTKVLADDWQCIESGPVSDVHLWGSWKEDNYGVIDNVHVSIHSDIPAGIDPDMLYSHPGKLLWQRDFSATEIVVRNPFGTGQEGWFNPNTGEIIENDHFTFHQINITGIADPFIQKKDTIYWLDITVQTHGDAGAVAPQWGWKTTQDHWNDDAVWGDTDAAGIVSFWNELRDPLDPDISLDMAFVITPEPATIAMLGLGSLVLLRKHRKNKA